MNTNKLALLVTRISAIVLFGGLFGLSLAGVNLKATLLGGHAEKVSMGMMALEGITVSVVILFGSLLVAGIIALLVGEKPTEEPTGEKKPAKMCEI